MNCASVAREALNVLGIPYRRLDLSHSSLYFCADRQGGIFNLSLQEEGTVRIWTFARTGLPPGKGGMKREYPEERGVIGFEVTEEDDLNIYSRQSLADVRPDEGRQLLLRQITDFLSLRAKVRG